MRRLSPIALTGKALISALLLLLLLSNVPCQASSNNTYDGLQSIFLSIDTYTDPYALIDYAESIGYFTYIRSHNGFKSTELEVTISAGEKAAQTQHGADYVALRFTKVNDSYTINRYARYLLTTNNRIKETRKAVSAYHAFSLQETDLYPHDAEYFVAIPTSNTSIEYLKCSSSKEALDLVLKNKK